MFSGHIHFRLIKQKDGIDILSEEKDRIFDHGYG